MDAVAMGYALGFMLFSVFEWVSRQFGATWR